VTAKLPFSFLLSSRGHHFIIGAPCRGEKEAWIAAIRESLTVRTQWSSEPTSSLCCDSKGDSVNDVSEGRAPLHIVTPSSPIPEVLPISPGPEIAVAPDLLTQSVTGSSSHPSSAPSKGNFVPLSSTDVFNSVRRPSPAARIPIDRGLEDVISETCRAARYNANIHDEELSPGSRGSGSSFSRSSSGLSMAGAMGAAAKNKLVKRVSVYAKSGESDSLPSLSPASSLRSKPAPAKKLKKLRIAPILTALSSDGVDGNSYPFTCSRDTMPDSPTPLLQCSSVGTSDPFPTQADGSAIENTSSVEALARQVDCPPKRSRSMVGNVRGLFYSQAIPLTVSAFTVTSEELAASVDPGNTVPVIWKWWSKESLRRRVRSAPESPYEGISSPPMQSDAIAASETEVPLQ
jgi:hypothetical protein